MSISTKKGDGGTTGLWTGERVSKDDLRVDAYGTLDELDSHLGEARYYVRVQKVKDIIEEIQNDLYRVMGQLASKDKLYVKPVTEADVDKLTDWVHYFEDFVQLTGFVIPGNTIQSAKLDICRTIARRGERRVVSLAVRDSVPATVLSYVNRLSDLLFIMARYEEKEENAIKYKA